MAEKAMLIDVSKCMGCRGCQVACKQWNELEADVTSNTGTYQNPPDLSPNTWNLVKFKEIGNNGTVRWLMWPFRCMHCTDASCVKVCPTGALYHHPLGFVAYDKDKCSGCGYCIEFCPFHVPHASRNIITGLGKMDKCLFCQDRVTNDLEPACAKTCPPGAIKFGNRVELVTEGRRRVEVLRSTRPKASLYGERELGGLHMLYVLEERPEVYGLPAEPKVPVVATAWQDVIQPLGYAAAGVVTLGLLLNLMVARARMIHEKEES